MLWIVYYLVGFVWAMFYSREFVKNNPNSTNYIKCCVLFTNTLLWFVLLPLWIHGKYFKNK